MNARERARHEKALALKARQEAAQVERRLAHATLAQRPLACTVATDGRPMTVRMAADFLAHEIQHDVMAGEREVSDAIVASIAAHRANARILAEDALLDQFMKVLDLTTKASCQSLEIANWIRARKAGQTVLPPPSMGSQARYADLRRFIAQRKNRRKK